MRKKQRPTLDVQITPMQHAWLDVLGVDAPWLERAPVVMKNQAVDVLAEGGGVITKTPVAPQPVSPPKPAHAREKIAQPTPTAVKVLPASFASIVARPHHGLDDLAQQISSCQACNLCQARQQVVVGAGVMQPAIMIVGEAPGEQEDRQGLPFVGKSGELLDSMLAAIGRHRDRDVYITNVVKCRPPANRAPRVEEVAACLPFLLAQIKAIQPKIILAMGRSAAHAPTWRLA